MHSAMPPHAIAIVGLAGRFPGADNLEAFWRNLRDGVEALDTFSDAELEAAGVPAALRAHPDYVRRGTVLDRAQDFDASFFGVSPREAQVLDPQHRIFLECAWEAMEHAGYGSAAARPTVGVYAGASMNTYLMSQLMRDPALLASVGGYQLMLGNDKDFLCTRVSYKLDLHGPSMTVQTACSTSLVAVEVACRALQRGECDMALAGGVSVSFPERGGYLFQEGMILSPDGHCRPFDAAARGTRAGAGAGIVVLKRLDDALADGDCIHAVIRGAAINNDGAAKAGYTAPSIDGQVEAIVMAQALAGVDPRSIGYIETHGTGTPLGDPIEIAALTQAFRASTSDTGFCHLGSLKANIGHLDAAAGVAGLIKAVLTLERGEIAPLVNFREPNPQLDLARSPFVASAQATPWPRGATPRRAAVSSFGIGGTNAHVVLEEAPPTPPYELERAAHLIVLSAKTEPALERASANLADHLAARPALALADVEWTLQAGRTAFAHRRAVVARDALHAVELLRQPPRAPAISGVHEGGERPVAFLFSGQGSQYAGMGAYLYRNEPVYREVIDRCAAVLEAPLEMDLRSVLIRAEEPATIHETRLAQPALFATELALATLWIRRGVRPSAMLGHSIGEYVAAHLAGVMSLEDALALVALRGRLMQALPAGAMAAVHLSADELTPQLVDGIEIAGINAPQLCAVSGPTRLLADWLEGLATRGVETRPLHTSHAFHSSMMEAALEPFLQAVDGIQLRAPTLPYVSNLSGTWITPEQATSPAYYASHLRQPVRFADGVRAIAADASFYLLEVGPGQALTSLARATLGHDGSRRAIPSLPRADRAAEEEQAMLEASGRLWVAGVAIDWAGLFPAARPRRVPLPTYPFERGRYGVDAPAPVATATSPAVASASHPTSDPENWFFAPTWTRGHAGPADAPRLHGSWLVLADAGPLASAVAAALREAGARPVGVARGQCFQRLSPESFRVRPGVVDDLAEVLRALRDEPGTAFGDDLAGALSLWQVAAAPDGGNDRSAPDCLVALAAALAPSIDERPLTVLHATIAAESVLDEPVRDPVAALALGPVLVLPTEIAGLRMRLLDVDHRGGQLDVARTAQALLREAANTDGESIVAHRGERRWLRRFERIGVPSAASLEPPLRRGGVCLITGGLGGMGLAFARWLGQHAGAKLLLTARTAMPARADWDEWLREHPASERHAAAILAIRDIEATGGEVMVAVADAADATAMARAIEAAHGRWGPLSGVIHAAGIAGSGGIALMKSSEESRSVLAPKVEGLDVLVQLLGRTELDFVALMSSINAVIGAPGTCDYASANAYLDAFPESVQRPACWRRVVAFDWSAWRDVGMAANLVVPESRREQWQAHLASAIPPAWGVEALARGLACNRPRLVIVPYDLVLATDHLRRNGGAAGLVSRAPAATVAAAGDSPAGSQQARPALATAFEAPANEAERCIASIWGELLGIDGIGAHDDFFDLGGHSLLATRVLARVNEATGVRLALRDVFEAPSVRQLAARLAAAGTFPGGATAAQDEREEIEF